MSDTLLPWQPCLGGALVTAVLKCTHVLLQRLPLRLPSSACAPQQHSLHCKPSGEPRVAFVISVINVIGSKYTFVAEGSTVDGRQEGHHKPAAHWSITITETSHAAVMFRPLG